MYSVTFRVRVMLP